MTADYIIFQLGDVLSDRVAVRTASARCCRQRDQRRLATIAVRALCSNRRPISVTGALSR